MFINIKKTEGLWDGEAGKGQNQVSSPIKANQSGQGTGKKIQNTKHRQGPEKRKAKLQEHWEHKRKYTGNTRMRAHNIT